MRVAALAFALVLAPVLTSAADAADLSYKHTVKHHRYERPHCLFGDAGPACWPDVWYGHFTGGGWIEPVGFQWLDDSAYFPTARACERWIGSLKRIYRHDEGWRTCLPIR
jgi:hypothetical protein